ncbi:MAG: metallophosphoesterase [Oscillospiraceae bacterium]|nr:metallophosphoesterase [Oscillospiraceae bacterium]
MSIGRIIFAVIVLLVVFGGMNFYVGRRLFQTIAFLFPNIDWRIFAGIYIVTAVSFILARLPLPAFIRAITGSIGSIWMGIFIYLFMFFIVSDVIIFGGNIAKIIPKDLFFIVSFYARIVAITLSVGVVCYGVYNATQTKFVSYDVNLDEKLSGEMNIVFIADLHLGDTNGEKRLEEIIRKINNQNPDIVCIAGDIFNDDFNLIRDPESASALLKSIESTYGVYAVLGNHDGGKTLPLMMDFLERSNVKLLNCEHVIIDERLVLIGRMDASPIGGFGDMKRKNLSEIMGKINVDFPIVVMEHNPQHIDEYGGEVDLILAGHTHKGQLFPANLITNAIFTVDYGHYQKNADSPHVIVTQGVSTWQMPMRVGSNNEIVSVIVR